MEILRERNDLDSILFFALALEIVGVEVPEVYESKIFRRCVDVRACRAARVEGVKGAFLDAHKLPGAVAARPGESVFVGPTRVAAAVIGNCKARAADRYSRKRIAENSSAIPAKYHEVVAGSEVEIAAGAPNEQPHRPFTGAFLIGCVFGYDSA